MEANINYTTEDVHNAFELHYNKQYPIRSRFLLILGVVLLSGSMVLFVQPLSQMPMMKWVVMLIGVFYVGFYFYRKRSLVKLGMANTTIKEMQKVIFKEEYIRFEGTNGQIEQEWSIFSQKEEDDFSILLYFSKNNFFMLPKRLLDKENIDFINKRLKNLDA